MKIFRHELEFLYSNVLQPCCSQRHGSQGGALAGTGVSAGSPKIKIWEYLRSGGTENWKSVARYGAAVRWTVYYAETWPMNWVRLSVIICNMNLLGKKKIRNKIFIRINSE